MLFLIFLYLSCSFFISNSLLMLTFLFFTLLYFFFMNFFSGIFFMDDFSTFMVLLTLMLTVLSGFSNMNEKATKQNFKNFHSIFYFISFLLLCTFSISEFLLFYLCFETVFILMFFLLINWGYSMERTQASFYMLFYTLLVSFPFLMGILTESLNNYSKSFFLSSISVSYWPFFILVFLVKIPVYGMHLWLPKAHVEAPVVGSMLLAGILLKLGFYGIFRFYSFNVQLMYLTSSILFSISLSSAMLACFLCLRQTDLKALVAYSSICHMGLALTGTFSLSDYGKTGMLLMLMSHGLCSSLLFFVLFVLYERFYSRSLYVMGGLECYFSFTLSFLFFSVFFNMGFPPSLSFFSEIFIFSGGISQSLFYLSFYGFVIFMSGVYSIYMFSLLHTGKCQIFAPFLFLSYREKMILSSHLFTILVFSFLLVAFFC